MSRYFSVCVPYTGVNVDSGNYVELVPGKWYKIEAEDTVKGVKHIRTKLGRWYAEFYLPSWVINGVTRDNREALTLSRTVARSAIGRGEDHRVCSLMLSRLKKRIEEELEESKYAPVPADVPVEPEPLQEVVQPEEAWNDEYQAEFTSKEEDT